ncbi:MAG TPA: hypothetical protein PKL96_04245, partial [Bacteroidales bacterium]|nr:hypothetical protein [Bacteroidales bacterium]
RRLRNQINGRLKQNPAYGAVVLLISSIFPEKTKTSDKKHIFAKYLSFRISISLNALSIAYIKAYTFLLNIETGIIPVFENK